MFELLVHNLLADDLVFLFNLLQFSLVLVPVTAGHVLILVLVKGVNRRMQVPYFFEQSHVFLLKVGLLLFFAEHFRC